MNSDTPFNPIPIPDTLLLAQETNNPVPPPSPGTGAAQKKAPGRKRTTKPSTEVLEAAAQSRWQRIKGRLTARLSRMDPETLKRILTAAGVAAGVIVAILFAIKFAPIALVLLLILSVALLLRLWDQIWYGPSH